MEFPVDLLDDFEVALTKILSVNNILLCSLFSAIFPDHEGLQIMDYVR